VPPLIPVSNVGVTAAKPMFILKINAKPNNNSADKSNFRLILPPPGHEIQLNNTLSSIKLLWRTYKNFDFICKNRLK
jgi:hypothetical protein